MNSKLRSIKSYKPDRIIQPIFTGGDVSLNADGSMLASCLGEDALLTNFESGSLLCRIEGDGEALTALVLTPSASHLVTCSRSLAMKIYSLERPETSPDLSATLIRTVKPHTTPVVTIDVDRTGTLLATGGADGVIKIWDIRGGFVTHTFRGHTGVISALHFFQASENVIATVKPKSRPGSQRMNQTSSELESKDDQPLSYFLASGAEDGKVRIWNLVKRKAIASLDSHVSVIRGLDFSVRENVLISGSRDRTLIVWDASSWKPRRTIPVLEVIESVGFVKGGPYVYTGGESGRLRIWNMNTSREVTREEESGNEGDGILKVLSIPDMSLLVTVHVDQSLLIRSLGPLESPVQDISMETLPLVRRISGTHDEIIDMAFVSQHGNLMALATNSESIRLISTPYNNEAQGHEALNTAEYFGADVGLLQGHEEIIICLDVDWSGCWLVTGAKDNTAKIWQIDHMNGRYECSATLTGHAESLGAVAFPKSAPSPESAAFKQPLDFAPAFLITGSQDKTIKRWDILPNAPGSSRRTVRSNYTRRAHDKDINAVDINPTGTFFASASQDKLVKIWSIEEGETQGVLRGHKRGVWSVKFAPIATPSIPSESGSTQASRGFALTGSGDKTVKIWSLSDYTCLRTFEGHTNSVLKVIWISQQNSEQEQGERKSPFVASAGGDGLVKVWDSFSGECAATLDNHEDRVWALANGPSTGHIVSAGGDGVITFWADTTASTAAAAIAASTERVEQEQTLLNHVHNGNYREAIVLALQLNHPARLLSLFTDVIKKHPPEEGSLSGVQAVDDVLTSLADEQLYILLLRLRDWNTNARTASVAQRIFWVVAKSYPASRLVNLRKNGRGLGDVLNGLKVYTERHYRRVEELVEESYLVDFVVRSMGDGGFVEASQMLDSKPVANGFLQDTEMVLAE